MISTPSGEAEEPRRADRRRRPFWLVGDLDLAAVAVCASSNSLKSGSMAVENWAAATSPEPTSSGPLMRICQTNRNAISRPQRDRP